MPYDTPFRKSLNFIHAVLAVMTHPVYVCLIFVASTFGASCYSNEINQPKSCQEEAIDGTDCGKHFV